MISKVRYRLTVITLSLILLSLLGTVSYAWFVLVNRTDSFIVTAAKVEADFEIYLNTIVVEPDYFVFNSGSSVTKSGVFFIDVADVDAIDYITNLRIDIRINSTIDTYLRVSIIDSLTLATIDFEGIRGEVAIVDQPIDYAIARRWTVNDVWYEDLFDAEVALGGITSNDVVVKYDDWYNNTLNDGFYYYPQKIERDMDSPQLVIPFIEEYDGLLFKTKSVGYSLQIAILVEAIQANNDAPIHNWLLPTPPWGGVW
jgi:hypothetical protein